MLARYNRLWKLLIDKKLKKKDLQFFDLGTKYADVIQDAIGR